MSRRNKPAVFNVDGDDLDDQTFEFQNEDGSPQSLADWASAQVYVRTETGLLIEPTTMITDSLGGVITLTWSPGQILEGDSKVELRLTRASDGKVKTYPEDNWMIFRARGRA